MRRDLAPAKSKLRLLITNKGIPGSSSYKEGAKIRRRGSENFIILDKHLK